MTAVVTDLQRTLAVVAVALVAVIAVLLVLWKT